MTKEEAEEELERQNAAAVNKNQEAKILLIGEIIANKSNKFGTDDASKEFLLKQNIHTLDLIRVNSMIDSAVDRALNGKAAGDVETNQGDEYEEIPATPAFNWSAFRRNEGLAEGDDEPENQDVQTGKDDSQDLPMTPQMDWSKFRDEQGINI